MRHPVDGEGPKPRVEKNSVVVVPALLFPYVVRGYVAGELVLQRVRPSSIISRATLQPFTLLRLSSRINGRTARQQDHPQLR